MKDCFRPRECPTAPSSTVVEECPTAPSSTVAEECSTAPSSIVVKECSAAPSIVSSSIVDRVDKVRTVSYGCSSQKTEKAVSSARRFCPQTDHAAANETSEAAGIAHRHIAFGDLIMEKKALGSGSMGTVFAASLKPRNPLNNSDDESSVAVKFVDGDQAMDVLQEMEILDKFLDHPNIVRTFAHFPHPHQDKYCIVMERMHGGDLEQYLDRNGPIDPTTTVSIMAQIFSALVSLHRRGVAHMDIKPANVMIRRKINDWNSSSRSDIQVCLVDFGLAVECPQPEMVSRKVFKDTRGTPLYAAPELSSRHRCSVEKADIWSCGVTMCQLLLDDLPYEPVGAYRGCPFRAVSRFVKKEGELPETNIFPESLSGCYGIISKCLKLDPEKRPTAEQALYELNKLIKKNRSPD